MANEKSTAIEDGSWQDAVAERPVIGRKSPPAPLATRLLAENPLPTSLDHAIAVA
jgi:hypothetical protein